MSIAKTFKMTPQGPQKMDGWHSSRHDTREAQDDARDLYSLHRSPEARRDRAADRQAARAARSVAAQLTLIDSRPGFSRRETTRLSAVAS